MKKKYVFILSFDVNLGNMNHSIVESLVKSDNEELYYSEVTVAKKIVMNSVKEKTGIEAIGVVLLNCTRTLNDNL